MRTPIMLRGPSLWGGSGSLPRGWCLPIITPGIRDWLRSACSPGKRFVAGIVLYVLGVYSYQPVFFHVFTDGLIGTGLTIILAHCARWVDRLRVMRSALVHIGAYSYGLYLLHQPYVLYFGEHLRHEPMLHFVLYAFVILGIISILSMLLEWYVNHLTNSLFYRPSRQDPVGQKEGV